MDIGIVLGNGLREAFGPTAAYFALLAIGLNVHYGYTGLANFGQIGFSLVGSYGVGITVVELGWSLWAGAVVGLLAGVVLALLMGIPTLRLRGDYFAIVTIAAAEILRLVIRSAPFVTHSPEGTPRGGPFGYADLAFEFRELNPFSTSMAVGSDIGMPTWVYTSSQLWSLTVTWSLVVIVSLVVWLLMRSPWGRVIKAIREDEDAVRALGKNAFGYKMQSLVIGGVIGALGGVMLAIQNSSVTDLSFQPINTFFAYAVLLLGGTATRWGPAVGAMIFWFLFTGTTSLLAQLDDSFLPSFVTSTNGRGAVTLSAVGLTIMLLMIFRPQGLLGNKRELLIDG
jgi:branched-chain amino acid transport system permease protein